MSTDWNKPAVTDAYTAILPGLVTALHDLACGLDPAATGSHSNLPTGALRWNASTSRWELYNGSSWGVLAATYAISISGNAATATSATTATNATTATHLAGGAVGAIPYQSSAGATAMLASGAAGYVLQANGAAAPAWSNALTIASLNATGSLQLGGVGVGRIVAMGAVAFNSSTSMDFGGIPSWARRITVLLIGVSVSGTSNPIIRIGPAGGPETTGYAAVSVDSNSGGTNSVSSTAGFVIQSASGSNTLDGAVTLVRSGASTWVAGGNLNRSNSPANITVAGSKTITGTLDVVRFTTVGGANTIDGGSIDVIYEG